MYQDNALSAIRPLDLLSVGAPKTVVLVILSAALMFQPPQPALALDPAPAIEVTGSGDEIGAYSMDISSDGWIYVAVEIDGPLGQIVKVRRSIDGGLTWSDRGEFAAADGNEFVNPSIHIAEGDVDRVFLAYEMRQQLSESGAVYLESLPLDLLSTSWFTEYVDWRPFYPPRSPHVTSDADLRADYSVYLSYAEDVKFWDVPNFVRSTDQGETWDDRIQLTGGAFYGMQVACAAGADDTIALVFSASGHTRAYVAGNRGASIEDWAFAGNIEAESDVVSRFPSVVHRPGQGEFLAAYNDVNSGEIRVHTSLNAGTAWESESVTLPLSYGSLSYGSLGYRVAGSDTVGDVFLAEPDGIDPLESWSTKPTGPGFTAGHLYPVQVVSDESKGGQWGVLGHHDTGSVEQLLFWGEWFNEATNVPDPRSSSVRMQAFPNPATNYVRFEVVLENPAEVSNDLRLEVFAADGRRVSSKTWGTPSADARLEWDLRTLEGRLMPQGVYYAMLMDANVVVATTPVVVQR